MSDELTDELDHLRDSIELASEVPMTADPRRVVTLHAPRLLAAIEAALELHVEAVIEDARPPFHYCSRCSCHPAWPCPEVAAISRALLGGEQP